MGLKGYHSVFQTFFILLILLFPAFSNSDFILRQSGTVFRGGISFSSVQDPFLLPLKKSFGTFSLQVPFSSPTPPGNYISTWKDSTSYLASNSLLASQTLMPSFTAGVPMLEGAVFFSFSENTAVNILSSIESAYFHLDTAISSVGHIALHEEFSSSLSLNQSWKTMSLGYRLPASSSMEFAFLLHRNFYSLSAHGNYYGNSHGSLDIIQGENSLRSSIDYSSNEFSGSIESSYQGESWSPEFAIRYKRLRYIAQMGTNISLTGTFSLSHNTPFYRDGLTLKNTITNVDNYFKSSFQDSLLSHSINHDEYTSSAKMQFNSSQIHTLIYEISPGLWSVSWTEFPGNFQLKTTADSSLSPFDLRSYADFRADPDHLLLFNRHGSVFHSTFGLFALASESSPKNKVTMLLNEWALNLGDYGSIVPVLDFGFTFGKSILFNIDFSVAPIARIRTGVRYEF